MPSARTTRSVCSHLLHWNLVLQTPGSLLPITPNLAHARHSICMTFSIGCVYLIESQFLARLVCPVARLSTVPDAAGSTSTTEVRGGELFARLRGSSRLLGRLHWPWTTAGKA